MGDVIALPETDDYRSQPQTDYDDNDPILAGFLCCMFTTLIYLIIESF